MSYYSQNDQRWKNTILGFNTGPTDTLGNYGCYVTAIADLCKWAGNDHTPAQINEICKQRGWFVNGGLISRDDVPSQICGNLQFAGRKNWTDAVSMNYFDDASDPNIAYIIKIDASHAPGLQSHFVMVWKSLGNGDLEIEDSWDGVRKPLSQYGNPSVVIYSAVKFIRTPLAPPAPPPVVIPEPVVVSPPPPPPPVPTPPSVINITPPLTASNTQKYSLVVSVPSYPSPGNAVNRTNSNGTLANGAYFIYNEQQGVYSLTKVLGVPQGTWVNPADNVVPVTPLPIKVETTADIISSYQWLYPNHESVEYKVLQDMTVRDMVHGGPDVPIKVGHNIEIYGYFRREGQTYLRPLTGLDEKGLYSYYGIRTTDIYTGAPYLDNEYLVTDKFQYGFEKFLNFIYTIWDKLFGNNNKENK